MVDMLHFQESVLPGDELAGRCEGWLDGLPRQARVVIRSGDRAMVAQVIRACLVRDLVAVPLDPGTSDDRLRSVIHRVAAHLVVDGTEPVLPQALGEDPLPRPDVAGLAFIIFTSGSTGNPKGVMLGRSSVVGNATKTAQLLGIEHGAAHATCLPLHHVNALIMSFVGTLITGARLSLCDPANYLKQIAVSGAATASIVPALLVRLLDEEYPWPDCLKYLVTAAAPLDSDLAARFYRRYGPRLRQGYGLSEAVNFSFMMPELDAGDFADQYVRRTPPVGLPLPGTEFRIEEGEVLLRSRDMMRGYWGDAEETARRIGETGWLRTGDLGELRDGLLVLRGRRDEIINYGGEKRYPLDIETQWRAAGLSGAFAAVPVSGAHLGTDVGLVLDEEAVAARVLYRAGSAILPAAAESAHVARTATGKLRRVWMGSRLSSMHDSGARYSELFRYAHAVAREIAASPYPPLTSRAGRVHAQAVALAACEPPAEAPVSAARSVAHDALDLLAATWPDLAAGDCDGSAMMHRRPGLWQRLMNEWPMNTYAHHVVQLLRRRGPEGPLLEIGSGVGNTTSLLAPLISGELVWSDRNPDLVRRGRWRDRGVVFDFDHDAPPGLGGFGVIVATNALHCAADKVRTLRTLRSMLRDDGTLVLGEGASPTTSDGLPWCLDFLFCAFDGWGDRSGFLSRWEWLVLLHEAGFVRSGYGVLRAGRFDLGGVIWGISDGE